MCKETTERPVKEVIDSVQLLAHWQGHRALMRRVIEAFPEEEFFSFSIGGMRNFSEMTAELLGIAGPGIREIATGKTAPLNENIDHENNKEKMLELWDQASKEINQFWSQIPEERFQEEITVFGQYKGTVISTIFYFIDNEIHHRAQAYVYLRALGVEPPAFWER